MQLNFSMKSAVKIQSYARGFLVRRNKEYFFPYGTEIQSRILHHMSEIKKKIQYSASAIEVVESTLESLENPLTENQMSKWSQYKIETELCESPSILHTILDDADERGISFSQAIKPDEMMIILKAGIKQKNMVCDQLAVYLALLLKNDASLPSWLKDEVYVCCLNGHVFVSIGAPSCDHALIADPWISYLLLPQKESYRRHHSTWEDRERGFLGDVQSFRHFLFDHSNVYVNQEQALMDPIEVVPEYTAIAAASGTSLINI